MSGKVRGKMSEKVRVWEGEWVEKVRVWEREWDGKVRVSEGGLGWEGEGLGR